MNPRKRITTIALVATATAAIVTGAVVSANAMEASDAPKTATVRIAAALRDGHGDVIECEYVGVDLATMTLTARPTGGPTGAGISIRKGNVMAARPDIVFGVAEPVPDAVPREVPEPGPLLGEPDAPELVAEAPFGVVAVASIDPTAVLPGARTIEIVRPTNIRPGTAAECAELGVPRPAAADSTAATTVAPEPTN